MLKVFTCLELSKMHVLLAIICMANLALSSPVSEQSRAVDLCSKYGRHHTMCLSSPGPMCPSSVETGIGFTEEEKQLILDMHNERRRNV